VTAAGTVGVVLMSMGEPEAIGQVRPYLRALLGDPDLVRFPIPALQPTFAWTVALLHAGRLRRKLAAIGGSPLRRLTLRQGAGLEKALPGAGKYRVYTAMRYTEPSARDAVRRMRADGVAKVVALPLYPQYCAATSGSSLKDLHAAMKGEGWEAPVHEVRSWPDHPGFIAALCGQISQTLTRAPGGLAHILFTAHGVPQSLISSGDPYQKEVERTVQGLRLAFAQSPGSLAYQSRTGRGRWLGPDAAAEIARLGRAGTPAVVVVPLSFVSDNSETIHDLDIALRQAAQDAGIKTFLRVPALNDSPSFSAVLRDLTLAAEAAS